MPKEHVDLQRWLRGGVPFDDGLLFIDIHEWCCCFDWRELFKGDSRHHGVLLLFKHAWVRILTSLQVVGWIPTERHCIRCNLLIEGIAVARQMLVEMMERLDNLSILVWDEKRGRRAMYMCTGSIDIWMFAAWIDMHSWPSTDTRTHDRSNVQMFCNSPGDRVSPRIKPRGWMYHIIIQWGSSPIRHTLLC